MDSTKVDRDFVPIVVAKASNPIDVVSMCGSGFILPGNLLITCWHCVRGSLKPGEYYAAAIKFDSSPWEARKLDNISQDPDGKDLAIANIDYTPEVGFELIDKDLNCGESVWTYGYPLTQVNPRPNGGNSFLIAPRYLQGYVMRAF
jgi:hypothetical protein